MSVLVVGANGATGRLLVEQLLNRGQFVKAIVRSSASLPESVKNHASCSIIHASVYDMSIDEFSGHVRDCEAVASCLGHNLSWKGIFGHPRRLVTETIQRLCDAIQLNSKGRTTRLLLMSSAGVRSRDGDEQISFSQRCAIGLLRRLVPPHADNENAADYLKTEIGQADDTIQWVAVRPDSLINAPDVGEYVVHHSPIRSAIFDPGRTSRINVAHFMADLIINENVWKNWNGQMPVIYNKT